VSPFVDAFLAVLSNAVLLVALGVVVDLLPPGSRRHGTVRLLLLGVVVGCVGIAVMIRPWEPLPGVHFDARSVLLSISGLFLGLVPTLVAAVITSGLRILQGGAGTVAGVGIIVVTGTIGVLWRRRRSARPPALGWGELFLFGVVVHAAMLALVLLLPEPMHVAMLRLATLPILLVLPAGTAVLGRLFVHRWQQRAAIATARTSERQLQRAQELAHVGSWELHLDTGEVYASRESRRIYGTDLDTPTIADIQTFPLPEYRERLDRALTDLVTGRDPYDLEFRIRRASDGEIREIHSVAEYDRDRHVVIGTIEDVTERNRAAAALQASEARFRATFEQAGVGIALVSPEGRPLRVNDRLCDILGYTREELMDLTVADIVHPEDHERNLGIRGRLLTGETGSTSIEMRYLRGDGEIVWTSLTVALVRDATGEPEYFVSVVVDVSARKRAEADRDRIEGELRQAQKMEAVGRLAGGVAHDFNNMLNVILGYTDLILSQLAEQAEFRRELLEIQKAAQRSADLTRQLLAFSRKQIAAPRVVDLGAAVEAQMPLLERLIGEDVALTHRPHGEPWPVRVDPGQVDQILANLVVNARDAIAGIGSITIETRNIHVDATYREQKPDVDPGEYVLLEVTDDGHGMDSETVDHVFEPFFTTKREGQGTGLGLSMVYGIVKQNQGFIHVYSEPDHGTTFSIYLPRFEGEEVRPARRQEEAPAATGTETILLVEDEMLVLEVARTVLERLGYRVLPAATPGEALALAEDGASHIDLLLTDVVMPEMDGKELADRIQALRPDIRTLFMTGYTPDAIVHRGVLDDGVALVQKPFTRETLARKVREVLNRSDR